MPSKSRPLACICLTLLGLNLALPVWAQARPGADELRVRTGSDGTEVPATHPSTPPVTCCRCERDSLTYCVNFFDIRSGRCTEFAQSNIYQTLAATPGANQKLNGFTCTESLQADRCQIRNPQNPGANICPQAPFPAANLLQVLPERPAASTQPSAPPPFTSLAPRLNIAIPGLRFGEAYKEGGFIHIPFLAQYISAVYRYAVTLAVILAVIMTVYGGFLYLIGSAAGSAFQGKKIILDAIVGMLLIMGGYVVLKTVSSKTVEPGELKVQYVEPVEENRILQQTGSMPVDANDHTPADDPATDLPASRPPIPPADEPTSLLPDSLSSLTDWLVSPAIAQSTATLPYDRMMAACGNRDGFTLPTLEEKVERLRSILAVWKPIAADEGGAIYVWGGNPTCTVQAGQRSSGWYLRGLAMSALPSMGEARLRPLFQTQRCFDVVKEARRSGLGTLAEDNLAACGEEWRNANARLVRLPARQRGMFCGDCGVFVKNIYQCFGGDVEMQRRWITGGADCGHGPYRSNGRYVFKLWEPTDQVIDENYSQLKFGDIMTWKTANGTAHVFLFTGGLPSGHELPFQMLEMGAGGAGDASSPGGRNASRVLGLPFQVSGVQAHADALHYLHGIAAGNRHCIWAFRPLEMP